jgi:glycerophosphoryl diester phosphodiesterase
MGRHVVYQSPDYLARLKQKEAMARLLPPLRKAADLDRVAGLKPFGVDAAWGALSKELIDGCHARGIQVFSDALGRNERVEEYRKAIGWGIDVIQTDHPLRVLRAVELEARPR